MHKKHKLKYIFEVQGCQQNKIDMLIKHTRLNI